jgi:hypothetical protein
MRKTESQLRTTVRRYRLCVQSDDLWFRYYATTHELDIDDVGGWHLRMYMSAV